jgi:hypothetical protein
MLFQVRVVEPALIQKPTVAQLVKKFRSPAEPKGSILRFAFCRICATLVNIHVSFSLYYHYTFRPNRPSSAVQVAVMKDSDAQCNAVLLFLCSCLGLIVGYVG